MITLVFPLVLLLLWLIGRAIGSDSRGAELPREQLPLPTRASAEVTSAADQAALLGIITQYNAADQQVAAMLSLDPIRQLLDETGPLFTRRRTRLHSGGRQARRTPHDCYDGQWERSRSMTCGRRRPSRRRRPGKTRLEQSCHARRPCRWYIHCSAPTRGRAGKSLMRGARYFDGISSSLTCIAEIRRNRSDTA
jgi:hypothetical protein